MTEIQKTRLLIVDDEAAQAEALRETLQDHGYVAVACNSAEDGLAALRDESFDLLLTDLMMPGTDGIALLREALRHDPTLVGIIMTGAGTIPSAVEAMQSGALDYILKPFKLSAILPVLSRALAVRKLRLENAALERQIRERSAELEAVNVELNAFTRSVSHDLRTPLIAVIGLAELVVMSHGAALPAEARAWIEQIHSSGQQMNRLIDDLLRLSRLGQQALKVELVDLAALAKDCAAEVTRTQPQGNVELVIGPLREASVDPSLLRQVFLNLLSNAFKFTSRKAQPRIEVGSVGEGDAEAFFVRDNGSGFDMARADRLFGAFQRLHSAAEFAGTGVGLSIVQQIVQRHGGRVWADAKVDEGAAFFFTLPRCAD